ncbi:MAG TPA: tetratricopeptide repeat protein [Acidobacteriota bacterium]|nr:tetratricopeptide repeat protein [Acidobacteriota bacterium]
MSKTFAALAVWALTAFPMGLAQGTVIKPLRIGLEPIAVPPTEELEQVVRDQIEATNEGLRALGATEVSDQQLSQAYGDLGRLYHAYEFHHAAESAYRNAYRLDSGTREWPHLMGLLLKEQGRLQEASLYFREALRIDDDLTAARVHLGRIELEQNRSDEAALLFRRVLNDNPRDAAARFGMGQVEMARGNWQSACDNFEIALQAVPEAGRIHYALGMAYREMGELEEARKHLARRNTVGVAPADPIADSMADLKRGYVIYTIRGRSQYQNGLIEQAAESFAEAVRAAPENAGARVNLATALARLDREEEAREHLRKALELEPRQSSAHFNLGALLMKEQPAEALQHFLAVLQERPDDPQALQWAARLSVRLNGEHADRLAVLASQHDRSDEAVVLRAVDWLVSAGQPADALLLLETAEEEVPGRGRLLHAWAHLLATASDPALRNGERAVQLAKAVYSARQSLAHGYTVALALGEAGQCAEAADWTKRMIKIAEANGEQDLARRLGVDLSRFQQGSPCRPPFTPDNAPSQQ